MSPQHCPQMGLVRPIRLTGPNPPSTTIYYQRETKENSSFRNSSGLPCLSFREAICAAALFGASCTSEQVEWTLQLIGMQYIPVQLLVQ